MPLSWNEVSQSPNYQALGDNEQEQARQQYFNDVVAPKVPDEHIQAAKQQFDTATNPNKGVLGKIGEFAHVGGKGIEAGLSNIGDIEQSLQAKATDYINGDKNATNTYQNSAARQETQDLNTQQATRTARANQNIGSVSVPYAGDVGAGDVANFAGRAMASAPIAGAAGQLAGAAAEGGTYAATQSNMLPKLAGLVGEGYAGGATASSSFASNAPTVEQSLSQRSTTANEAGWYNVGLSLLTKAAGTVVGAIKDRTISGAEQTVGTKYNEAASSEAINKYTSIPKEQQPHNLPTSAVDTNTDTLALRKESENSPFTDKGQKVNPSIELEKQTEANNTGVANELKNFNISNTADITPVAEANKTPAPAPKGHNNPPEPMLTAAQTSPDVANAPVAVKAQENVGTVARDISNQKRAEINTAYKNVAPDDTIEAPIDELQQKFEDINSEHHDNIHGDDVTDKEGNETPGNMLSEIDSKYVQGDTASVRQMIQDKNNIGDFISGQYRSLKNDTLSYNEQVKIKGQIEAARKMRDALKEHISGIEDVPSAVEGKSVGEAFTEAEGKYQDYNKQFLENPEQHKVNENGVDYGHSTSDFGEYDYRLQKGTAGSLAQEGKKLLSVENPDALGAQLKNMRNVPDADSLVKTNLLAVIKEKGFDKAYTPEVKAQLESNGFESVSKDIQAIGDDLSAKNYTIAQKNALLEQHRQVAQDTMEKTFADKVVAKEDIGKLLTDKDMQTQALELANKANDNGATKRGLGKAVLDKIRNDNIKTYEGLSNSDELKVTEGFKRDLDKHREFLQKTIPNELKALDAIQNVAQNLRYSENTSALSKHPEGIDTTEKAVRGAAVTVGGKSGIPTSGSNSLFSALTNIGKNSYKKVLFRAESDPYYAKQLMDAANKDPSSLPEILKGLAKGIGSATTTALPNAVLPHDSTKQTPLDKEVQDVTKPRSDNSDTGLSLVSNADASELPNNYKEPVKSSTTNTTSKKNIDNSKEYKIADASKETGMPKEYFNAVEKAETQGQANPDKAKPIDKDTGKVKSSAYGRAQFTEGTWNEVAKKHGLPLVTDSNRLKDTDPRSNPKYARLATGYYGSDNAEKLKPWIKSTQGRETTIGDVYSTHLMGLQGFKDFLSASPSTAADKIVPMAAKNNKSLFYDENGKSLSVRQVYRNIEDRLLPNKAKPDSDGEPDE